MEQESYPLKSCPHPRRLVQVNIGLWVSFQFFTRLAAVFAEEVGGFGVLVLSLRSHVFYGPI